MAAFLVNAVLIYILIPSYGAAGAALATVISFFVFFTIRTESSAWLWLSLPRLKIYFLIVLYMVATAVMVMTEASIRNFNIIWLVLMLLVFLMYYSRFLESASFLKTYLYRRS
jgi:O-antigen/teichoic acid export membrane protein